jgi:hypothetical protein
MFVVEIVGPQDHPIVEALVTRLVAPDQQDRHAAGIERVEDPQRLAFLQEILANFAT